ncbi:hypothetical protein NEDG_00118 [Nematocida displodere]|uniref:Uncharacterized protein n=1 Tax=Nematocida displodere TaxID=1805483 RepID=A0A177EI40_9MICR|nr:hypothetical protein NEDG_00118 [Nematocida displodere]
MKTLGVLALVLAAVHCYIDADAQEVHGGTPVPFKTLLFLRRLTPSFARAPMDRPLPYGARKRIESEEKFSPFHSVLVVRKRRRPEDVFESMVHQMDGTDSFIKDFLSAHLQHLSSLEQAPKPRQFNTEKIYNDLYRKSRYPPKKMSRLPESTQAFGDEIDAIIAHAAKEAAPESQEPEEKSTSIGKQVRRTRKTVGKHLSKAKKRMVKGFRLNGLTIALLVTIAVISGFVGYSIRGRSTNEHYIPLPKQ